MIFWSDDILDWNVPNTVFMLPDQDQLRNRVTCTEMYNTRALNDLK